MRIVVLGANGQLGSRILARLLQEYPQAQVVGCVREKSIASVKGNAGFLQHLLPFNPFRDDWAALGKVDVLINCIGIIRETASLSFEQAHLGLTKLMLQHREQLGNPKLIQLSALGADPQSPSGFLRTKGQADALLLTQRATVVVRPSIVCTPGTMLSRKLQLVKKLCRFTGGLLLFPEQFLETKLQPVAVADLTALVSQLCLQREHPAVVEVAGKERYTLRQLLELVPTCRNILPLPQALFRMFSPLLYRLFPALIDKEQAVLLQHDNIAETDACEKILGRPMASTLPFWQQELA
ncbi:Rossmann-fold NAD(P)-binding domain-containing protein [Botryobacter ruber]|uniref:hypothetical protein n=1 Tax=Botryobacter ruber TaxID=2171629 RepID=UPI000E0AF003|nr:hypothetical protein [Botryobacter ruber]